jgi:hypothetical protein
MSSIALSLLKAESLHWTTSRIVLSGAVVAVSIDLIVLIYLGSCFDIIYSM